MKVSVVVTTISVPVFLLEYFRNLRESEFPKNDVTFLVVGDEKSPYNAKVFSRLHSDYPVEYWEPGDQTAWLFQHFPDLQEKILSLITPKNSPRRRNFGYLRALELDSDVIVVVDDDNFPIQGTNWLGEHLKALSKSGDFVESSNRIINPCGFLRINSPSVYSRGYPLSHVFEDRPTGVSEKEKKVMLNMGLWTGKPDVDAFANLIHPELESLLPLKMNYSVSSGNYFPIDTQNTSFRKELGPVFFNIHQQPCLDLPSDRYDDIWGGLFALRLIHRMGDTASFGTPFLEHRRNIHNYLQDLRTEMVGMTLNSRLWEAIMDLEIKSKRYLDGYLEIAYFLTKSFRTFEPSLTRMMFNIAESMRLWSSLVETLI